MNQYCQNCGDEIFNEESLCWDCWNVENDNEDDPKEWEDTEDDEF
jgi:NMD protein affecting ribosome stability and mRNA decay